MNNVNIFESGKPQNGEFFAFKKVGDGVQGTWVDKFPSTDSYGNQQTVYVLIDTNRKVWNCGFREGSVTGKIIAQRMATVNFGNIVGFRFDAEVPSKVKKGAMAKVINAYVDPKLMDYTWVAKRKEIEEQYNQLDDAVLPSETLRPEEEDFRAPSGANAMTGNMAAAAPKPKNEALDAIRNLAKTKGLTNDAMGEEAADSAIEAYTGFSLEETNLTKIIIKLTGFSK